MFQFYPFVCLVGDFTFHITMTLPFGRREQLGGGVITPIWGRFPFQVIVFRWVETTNQIVICFQPPETTLSQA